MGPLGWEVDEDLFDPQRRLFSGGAHMPLFIFLQSRHPKPRRSTRALRRREERHLERMAPRKGKGPGKGNGSDQGKGKGKDSCQGKGYGEDKGKGKGTGIIH